MGPGRDAGRAKDPPHGLLNDVISGIFGALGAYAALICRAKEGGSYHVKVSLCRSSK
jgi:crotonobetainyl-CoA:carnitine CoA-transferase CaiB-like acyl-CoA transferase